MIKKTFNEKLLTTASAFAISAVLASGSYAATVTVDDEDGAGGSGITAGTADDGASNIDSTFTATDDINIDEADATNAITLSIDDNVNTATITVAAAEDNTHTLTFDGTSTVTGNLGTTGGGNDFAVVNAGATGETVTVSGNIFSTLTNITGTGTLAVGGSVTGNIDFDAAADGKVTLAAGQTITGDVTATTAGEGTLEFLAAGTMTGEIGVVGGNELKLVTINAGAVTASGDVAATTINFAGDGSLEIASGKDVEGAVTATTDSEGTLTFVGTAAQALTGQVGSSTASIKLLSMDSTNTLTTDGDIYADTITFEGTDDGVISIGAGHTVTGNITTDTATDGTVTFAGAGSIVGNIGAVGANEIKLLTVTGANAVTTDGDIAAATINFTGDGSLSIAAGHTVEGAVTAASDGEGTVTFAGAATVTGTLGNDGANALKLVTVNAGAVTASGDIDSATVNFAGDGSLEMASTTELEGAVTVTTTNTGTLSFVGASGTITGQVGTTTNKLKLLSVDTTGTLTTTEDIFATTVTFEGTDDGVLSIAAGKDLTAAVTADTSGDGTITMAGAGDISGQIGTSTAEIKLLTVGNGAVTTDSKVYATSVNFAGDNTFTVAAGKSIISSAVSGTAGVTTGVDDEGTLTFSGTTTVGSDIATAALQLNVINFSDGTATVSEDLNADTINLLGDAVLEFTGSAKTHTGDIITAGTSILDINGNAVSIATGDNDTGLFTMSGNGTFRVSVTGGDNNDSGKLTTVGAVDLNDGNVYVNVTGSEFIAAGATYDVLVDGAGNITDKDGITISDDSFTVSFTGNGSTASNTLTLTSVRTNTLQSSSSNVNESAVGTALEAIAATGDANLDSVQGALQGLTTAAAVEAALETLNSDVSGAVTSAAADASDAAINVVGNRLSQIAGIDGTAIATGGAAYEHGVWAEAFGTSADQSDRDNVKGYQADTIGFAIGADTKVNDQATIGLSFAYADTEADSANGDAEVGSYQVNVYGSYDYGKWFSEGLVGVTFNDYETKRNISVGSIADQAKGDFDGQQYTIKVGAGYKLDVEGGLNVTPKASARYNITTIDAYSETGSTANLRVDNDDIHRFEIATGVDLNYPIIDGSVTYIPSLSVGVSYDLVGDEQETKNNFTGASSTVFTNKGADVAQVEFELGAGLDILAQDNLTVSFDYDWTSKEDYNAHTGAVKARFAF